MAPREIVVDYEPRPLQAVIHAALERHRWACIVTHRRFGKSVLAVNHLQRAALTHRQPRPRFAYLAPTYTQGKAIAWDYLLHYAKQIPGVTVNVSELRVDYPNGGQVRIFGADNPDSLRGLYFDGVVLDEYGLMVDTVFTEVILPTLVDRQGWAVFMGTPNGANEFYRISQKARDAPDWFSGIYRASETGILQAAELQMARESMTEDEYQQEFECSFSASVKGAVFARELQSAHAQGRVTTVPYRPELPVETAWDLGVRDATAIWFTQSDVGGSCRVIDYYENVDRGLDHYADILAQKGYHYGLHVMPHDIAQRELTTGRSRLEVARALLRPAVTLVPQMSVDDGIHAARLLLARCYFDAIRCREGLQQLLHYRYDYNTRVGAFTRPLHDAASHAADAFRTLAVGQRTPRVRLTPEKPDLDISERFGWRRPAMPASRGGYA